MKAVISLPEPGHAEARLLVGERVMGFVHFSYDKVRDEGKGKRIRASVMLFSSPEPIGELLFFQIGPEDQLLLELVQEEPVVSREAERYVRSIWPHVKSHLLS
jgi:hypothetical protein